MSGDVQPRKRKDKKRKKDELSVEEPRGTAAALGEGDVFIHSQHEHGTGGHWCAKIIFFSLLAVLLTLIGLIILENRGLTDLEANSVESRYSGVLEGWLEDPPDDDHHDEHTLELKHHDNQANHDDDKDYSQEIDHDEDEDHDELDHDNEIDQQSDEHDEDNLSDENLDEENEDRDEDLDEKDEVGDEDLDENDDDDDDENQEQNDYEEHTENDGNKDSKQEDEYETTSPRQADENSEEQGLEDADDEDDDQELSYEKYIEKAGWRQRRRYEDEDSNENEIEDDLQQVDDSEHQDDDNHDAENNESIENDDEHFDQEKESLEEDDTDDNNKSLENNIQLEENSFEYDPKEQETTEEEDEEEHADTEEEDSGVEVEKLEKEISDEDALSIEKVDTAPTKEDYSIEESSNEEVRELDADLDEELAENDADEEEFLEVDDIDEPLSEIEQIKVLPGKPLAEVEESTSEKPPDTLEDEEEYEKRQEEIRRAQAEESHVWLKLVVGGALLAATHAVMRRATAPRDTSDNDEHAVREDTPLTDRRMTLIPGEAVPPAPTKDIWETTVDEPDEDEIIEEVTSVINSVAPIKQESEEYDEEIEEVEDEEIEIEPKEPSVTDVKSDDKELYSDDEEAEDEEDPVIEEKNIPKESAPITQTISPPVVEIEPEDVSDDVEIIDDEQFEEELEEEDEEDISDVDDAELLSRLEAKYGRLPEPHRPEPKHKDGGNSIEDDWPGEPSDAYWRQQLDQAENDLRQGEWSSAIQRASAPDLKGSARAKWILAQALDSSAEARRDNALLSRAIAAYLELLKMNERLSDKKLLMISDRTLDRMRFRGNYLGAEPVYRLLVRRFPDDPAYRNNMTINFLMANRADLASAVLKETLKKWPNDRVALAHHGFVLKTTSNRLEEAVEAFQKALQDDIGPATEPRFYYHLGDALLLLGRFAEAQEIHKRGAALGHFLSPAQRSLYNVDRLKSRPWWSIEQTPYAKLARALEKSWKEILKEGEAARALYEKEKEGLKERGEWSQLDLFMRGTEVPGRCSRAPVTCSIVRSEPAAVGCRRGQVKFSLMQPGTHVRPHVGPTNCRLRMHLGLSNTKDTYIRVDQEIRQWQLGKTLMFDDSFEHEVWHNGTAPRLVLIVDVWHPDLTISERRSLPAI